MYLVDVLIFIVPDTFHVLLLSTLSFMFPELLICLEFYADNIL
jgi:hypothetical protein